MKSKTSPYEVRCPRCDVSFPVETRKCMHCGGPTSKAGSMSLRDSFDESAFITLGESTPPDGSPSDSPFARAGGGGGSGPAVAGGVMQGSSDPGPLEADAESPSTLRSLVQSLGGVVWIVLLIAFAVARTCTGE